LSWFKPGCFGVIKCICHSSRRRNAVKPGSANLGRGGVNILVKIYLTHL
jgi:hypothetical protein